MKKPQTPFWSHYRWLIIGAALVGVFTGLYFLNRSIIVPHVLKFLEPSGDYKTYFYRDADGDGRGSPEEKIIGKWGEEPPPGYTEVVGDCNDHDPNK